MATEGSAGMKKSTSYSDFEALDKFSKDDSGLGKDGALIFDKVGYFLPNVDKWLVKDITGYVKCGQTLAIIGASGSGK